MLYHIYEAQRALLEPFADFAQATAKLYSSPLTPLAKSPMTQRTVAAFDLFYRLAKDYEKPQFGIQAVQVNGVDVTIRERVEIDKPFCELRRFKRFSDHPATLDTLLTQPAVLIVAPLSGHYATLLRDTVRSMLGDHKVYITDWKNARMVPLSEGEFHLDDYINYVQEFIRHLQARYGNCHVISVCQPTVPVLAAVSLMASRGEKTPLSMTMMGGPINAQRSPTSVNNLAMQRSFEWFENNVIHRVPDNYPGAGRRVYPGFLQHTGFVAMNPDRHTSSHYDYFRSLTRGDEASAEQHRKFYNEYNAVLDLDAPYYLQTIRVVFQDFNLVRGTWDIRNPEGQLERVRPQDIRTTALLTIEGELDDISGVGQTQAAHELCSDIADDAREHIQVAGAGHYGIFSGSRWRNIVYPQVRAFILRHHQLPASADNSTGAAIENHAASASITITATEPAAAAPEPISAAATLVTIATSNSEALSADLTKVSELKAPEINVMQAATAPEKETSIPVQMPLEPAGAAPVAAKAAALPVSYSTSVANKSKARKTKR
ncbi:MAG: polyhydroxyalkanoate depolymerase [Comamonas sp.]|nr:polyhydroxyalkanoate depolymerase [Comamonas sp.]